VSVSAIAGGEAWAVGYETNLAMWWGLGDHLLNGSWQLDSGPPSQCWSDVYRAWSVTAVNPTFGWQVAECQGSTIIGFWNGVWNQFPAPQIPGANYNVLFGISSSDTHSGMAVGGYNLHTHDGSGPQLPYIALYSEQ
jgi:hypothetical protein